MEFSLQSILKHILKKEVMVLQNSHQFRGTMKPFP
jgi:hypothetical protein